MITTMCLIFCSPEDPAEAVALAVALGLEETQETIARVVTSPAASRLMLRD
jgi:hypothetical protein